jgi:hypothetical protein
MYKKEVKKFSRVLLLGVVVVLVCVIAGCSSQQPSSNATQTPAGTTTAQPVTTAATTTPAPGSVTAVDFNTLITFLPNAPAGWTAADPYGMTNQYEGGSWSMASREYTNAANDSITASVMIMDSAYYDVGPWAAWGTYQQVSTTEGYWKSDTVSGYPAWESYTKSDNTYGKWIGINQRFMVVVTVDGGQKSDLDALVSAINYQGIGNLK